MLRSHNYKSAAALGSLLAIGITLQVVGSSPAWAKDDDDDRRGGDHRGGEGDRDKLPVYLDHPVHPTAQDTCTPGYLWQGAGNPATTFQRKRDLDAGIELAIKAIYRGGPDIRSTYVDGDGIVHIEVPAGPQVTPATPNRAIWNFTYSYDVALKPGNPTLDGYDAELWIDVDPSKRTKFFKLELAKLAPPAAAGPCPREKDFNGYGWRSGNTTYIPDDEGTERVTQNSQNFGFGYYRSQIDGDPNAPGIQPYNFGPGEFDIIMSIKRKHGGGGDRDRTVLHVVFDVVAAPSQTP